MNSFDRRRGSRTARRDADRGALDVSRGGGFTTYGTRQRDGSRSYRESAVPDSYRSWPGGLPWQTDSERPSSSSRRAGARRSRYGAPRDNYRDEYRRDEYRRDEYRNDYYPDALGNGAPQITVRGKLVRSPGDSNCLFSAMSHGLRDGLTARMLREEAVDFIRANPMFEISPGISLSEWIDQETGMSILEYTDRMARGGHGGVIEMAVVAVVKNCNVEVYEQLQDGRGLDNRDLRFKRTSVFQGGINPKGIARVVYQGGVHYDALEY